MPETFSEEKLAEDFTDFFINRIQKRDALDYNPTYEMTDTMAHCKMDSFEKMYEDDVKRILKKMQTKSCKSNILPTDLLKKSLKGSINIITRIINMSLKNRIFTSRWKISIIRPLLKKLRFDLMLYNYRPVSNLPSLSKVLEQCVPKQFNNHCRKFDLMPDYQTAYCKHYSC